MPMEPSPIHDRQASFGVLFESPVLKKLEKTEEGTWSLERQREFQREIRRVEMIEGEAGIGLLFIRDLGRSGSSHQFG